MDEILGAKSIEAAHSFASSGCGKIRRLMLDGASAYRVDEYRREAEFAYANLMEAMVELNTFLSLIPDTEDGGEPRNNGGGCHSVAPPSIHCCFENRHIFRCEMGTAPLLKTQSGARKFFEYVCLNLQREVVKVTAGGDIRFPKAIVIFINHWVKSASIKQPYYDNDNLAVKGILDSIIPFICFDDACVFCDNIYLAQPDTRGFTEVYVIEAGHLMEWAAAHNELAFVGEITMAVE